MPPSVQETQFPRTCSKELFGMKSQLFAGILASGSRKVSLSLAHEEKQKSKRVSSLNMRRPFTVLLSGLLVLINNRSTCQVSEG